MTGPGAGPDPGDRAALWDRASLSSGTALGRAAAVAATVLVLAALVALVGGWPWALSVAVGGGVVLVVLWSSARVLTAGARRSSPAAALGLAVLLYLVVVVGLYVLAAYARPGPDGDGPLRAAGVAGGVLGVVGVWSSALLLLHVRHDRGPRKSGR